MKKLTIMLTILGLIAIAAFLPWTSGFSSTQNPTNTKELLNGHGYDADNIQKGINIAYNRILEEYTFNETAKEYCDGKSLIGTVVYADMKQGKSLEDTLAVIRLGYENNKKEGSDIPRHVYVEYQRMTQIVYRHSEKSFDKLYYRFYSDCLELGF